MRPPLSSERPKSKDRVDCPDDGSWQRGCVECLLGILAVRYNSLVPPIDRSTLAFGLTTKPSIESDYHPKWVTEWFRRLPGNLCASVRKCRCVLLTLESFQPCKTSNQTMLTLFWAEIGKIAFALCKFRGTLLLFFRKCGHGFDHIFR